MKRILMLVIAVFTAFSAVFAALGGVPFDVLHKTLGARNLAMGEAAVANCGGPSTILWNPAALDSVNKNTVYAGAEMLFEGAHMEYISYYMPVGKYGGLAFLAGFQGYGGYEAADGGGIEGVLTDDIKDIFISAGYGKSLIAGVQAGLTAKVLLKSLPDGTYPAFNSDISFFKSFDMIDIGLAFKNIIPMAVAYSSQDEKFVSTMRLGFALKLLDNNLKIAADMEKYFIKENPVFFAGAEYRIINALCVRAGYNTLSEISGGIGLNYENIGVDYAVVYNELGLSHKAGISYAFGGYGLELKAEPSTFSPMGAYKKTYIRVLASSKYEMYKWSIDLKNSSSELIRNWSGAGKPDDEVIWDGLRTDGMPYPDGMYNAVLTTVDENDVTSKSDVITIQLGGNESKSLPLFGE